MLKREERIRTEALDDQQEGRGEKGAGSETVSKTMAARAGEGRERQGRTANQAVASQGQDKPSNEEL